ncbi:hypothetical protein B9Z55_014824 [Caenorhabditis nigoni]|uniref:SUN domain-containing protein n=1 Tax=Caenorhabditis nigoni TaxID=1611254 RepID=A0A2G5U7G7_9PELO|nr:hypothetical protein B9Z55_014824 [Caenorhabditis nigoni]
MSRLDSRPNSSYHYLSPIRNTGRDSRDSAYGSAYGSAESQETNSLCTELTVEEKPEPEPNNDECKQLFAKIRRYRIIEIFTLIVIVAIILKVMHCRNQEEEELTSRVNAEQTIEPPVEVFRNPKDIVIQQPILNDAYLEPLEIPIGKYIRFNAASYVDGARVSYGTSKNSRAKCLSLDQSNFVLFERDELPPGKAWCTIDNKPVLNIRLTTNVTPIAVSYQHTKWYGTVPYGAPKVYDVYSGGVRLAANCKYQVSEDIAKGNEQICKITKNLCDKVIDKIQFVFHENYGNVQETCAYLFRVYAEKRAPKIKEKPDRNSKFCTDVADHFYNDKFSYSMSEKDCKTLYVHKCCSDCPECCRDCEMADINFNFISIRILFVLLFIFLTCFAFRLFPQLKKWDEKKKSGYRSPIYHF